MKFLTSGLFLLLAFSPLATAKNHGDRVHNTIKAKVVSSTPVFRYVANYYPSKTCKVANNRHLQGHTNNNQGVIFGSVVGGVIGHASSQDRHKVLGTLVGAVIGGSVASSIVREYPQVQRPHRQRCLPTYQNQRKTRVLDGYNVTYRSKGKLYQTHMKSEPGRFVYLRY